MYVEVLKSQFSPLMPNPGLQITVTHLNKYGWLCQKQSQEGKLSNISEQVLASNSPKQTISSQSPWAWLYVCMCGWRLQGGKDERVTTVLLERGMNPLQRKSEVINHSVTMAEGWLGNVVVVGWLTAQNEATANQMCSAACVLPLLCVQPVAYPNCIFWNGLWEAEVKARAQITFFHFTVLYPHTPHFPCPTPLCCILMRKFLVQTQAILFGY